MYRFDGDDGQLRHVLGISRSTLWRLKKGKIDKLDKYINILEKNTDQVGSELIETIIDDLKLWSNDSKELREILTSLHSVLQESATN